MVLFLLGASVVVEGWKRKYVTGRKKLETALMNRFEYCEILRLYWRNCQIDADILSSSWTPACTVVAISSPCEVLGIFQRRGCSAELSNEHFKAGLRYQDASKAA